MSIKKTLASMKTNIKNEKEKIKKYKPDYYTFTLEEQMIKKKLEALFYSKKNKQHEHRYGLHASAIIATDGVYCLREQLLSLFFEMNQGSNIKQGLMQIFAAGNSIHEKWQSMLDKNGYALAIEGRGISQKYDLTFTPDGVLMLNNRKYVLEIKSMSTFSYSKNNGHPSAEKQIQLYMYMLSIPNGIILMEDKNTQAFRIQIVRYDYEKIKLFIDRLNDVRTAKKSFLNNSELPIKKCKDNSCKRAQECSMLDACFNIGNKRKRLKNI